MAEKPEFEARVWEWIERLENPDFHIGLADRYAVAWIMRRLLHLSSTGGDE